MSQPTLPVLPPAEDRRLASRLTQTGLRDMVGVVLRRRWIVLSVALPIIIIAAIGTIRTADVVRASGRVLIEARQPENPTFQIQSVDYDVLMSTAAQVAVSIPVATRAAEALVDSLPVLHQVSPQFGAVGTAHDLCGLLLSGADCSQVGESNILNVSFAHTSPRFALMAVGALMQAYITYCVESQQNRHAIAYYDDQIAIVKSETDSLMNARAAVLKGSGYAALQSDVQVDAYKISSMEQSYFRFRSDRESIEAGLRALEAAIAKDPDYVPTTLRSGENINLVGLKSDLDKALADLGKLRLQYTDDSEWVGRQQQVVDQARAALYRERANYIEGLRIALEQTRASEQLYADAAAQFKGEAVAYPDLQSRIESLDLQISTQKKLLEALQVKRGEVRLKADSDMRISSVLPLNSPSIDMRVAGSKKALYLSLASVFALALGLISALFADSQDHRIYSKRQAEAFLEVPLLGTVTDGAVPEERP